jgi:hypothetical protein
VAGQRTVEDNFRGGCGSAITVMPEEEEEEEEEEKKEEKNNNKNKKYKNKNGGIKRYIFIIHP